MTRPTPAQLRLIISYLGVGLLNTAVGYGLFAAFILLGVADAVAVAGATILGVLFNFQSTGRLVFGSRDARLLPRFVGVYFVMFVLNVVCLRALAALGLGPLLGQALLVLPFALLGFVAMRRFVFAGSAVEEASPDDAVKP